MQDLSKETEKPYDILKKPLKKNSEHFAGEIISDARIGDCLVLGFSSKTDNVLLFSYEMQKVVCLFW